MRVFSCSRCGGLVNFEDRVCLACASPLGYLHGVDVMKALDAEGSATADGRRWHLCASSALGCNWLVAEDAEALCLACRLIRRRPDPDDALGTQQLAQAAYAERRLLFQLLEHALPVTGYYQRDGGLAFDLLSSMTYGQRVMIGHANGVVTIDLSEVGDAYRESLRVELGEPYRTMLGHFRHEIGHYYQQVLVTGGELLERCRELFGDERASYAEALDRHYGNGAPAGWQDAYISEYATMHPWEDFAECWAHYLHITDTLQTAASFRMALGGLAGDKIQPLRGSLSASPHLSLTGYHEVPCRRTCVIGCGLYSARWAM